MDIVLPQWDDIGLGIVVIGEGLNDDATTKAGCQWALTLFRSKIESDVHNIAVLYDVLFSFQPEFPLGLGLIHAAQ